jgi:hypothetical protein
VGRVTRTSAALLSNLSAVLNANWQTDHTVPARTLYPHQWSWDAAFIAVGLAHIAPRRAWQDLRTLFAAQWPDGRVPHIVFDTHVADRDYFPGPSFWGRGTSGIVQPPVHALAARHLHTVAPSADDLAALYPALVAQQHYLFSQRDLGGCGLVSIAHPWESGLDNSPAWDPMLAILADTAMPFRRRDVEVSVTSHRPTDRDYARYIALAAAYRDNLWVLDEHHPFLVECPAFNALTVSAELALAEIAGAVGADPMPHQAKAKAMTETLIDRLYDPATGMFHALDVHTARLTPARTVGGLIPLIVPGLPSSIVDGLVKELTSPRFGLPAPSYDRSAPDFDRLRYWRGPTWINMNWLLWKGLHTHGHTDHAATLRAALIDLVAQSGCYEYFDPITGQGIGAAGFSWTAALTLDLLS